MSDLDLLLQNSLLPLNIFDHLVEVLLRRRQFLVSDLNVPL